MSELLPDRRRREILERVRAAGAVRAAEPAAEPEVSDVAVRRVPDRPAREGQVQGVHGGAELPAGSPAGPGPRHRSWPRLPEKAVSAAVAQAMVARRTPASLNSGSTTRAPARRPRQARGVAVVTNSPRTDRLDGIDTLVMDTVLDGTARRLLSRHVPALRPEPAR